MRKFGNAILLETVVFCALILAAHSGVIDVDGKNEYTKFFKKLTQAEKRAVMSLAIAYHDAPESSDGSIVFPTNPIKPKVDEIPPTIFSSMMNGNIPNQWMKKFIRWLQRDLKISNSSFNLYRHDFTDDLCNEDNSKCYPINDVGQQCCPFG